MVGHHFRIMVPWQSILGFEPISRLLTEMVCHLTQISGLCSMYTIE